jgi:hypothetical protein
LDVEIAAVREELKTLLEKIEGRWAGESEYS